MMKTINQHNYSPTASDQVYLGQHIPATHAATKKLTFPLSYGGDSDHHAKNKNTKHYVVLAATFLIMLFAAYGVYTLQPRFEQLRTERMASLWGMAIIIISLSLLAIRLSILLYVAVLSLRYKSKKGVADDLLPSCTVIVPAYNEGKLVLQTLLSLANNDYPKEKIQLIAIDDGSKDDTWAWMQKAKDLLGNQLTIHQQPENKGKRHALYRGFELATGAIFITVDSDSIVKEDTLRNMVSPFVDNEQCGAVAGNVRVLNKSKAIIPKMMQVSFAFSFEFIRAAQSVLGSVFCTPGALAAYRKEAVLTCLPEWIEQTFMGKPSDIGEDRAMTNMILKQGYKVLFQRNAVVYTNVPESFTTLYKMYIRWERSNVRENIMMTKFAFTSFRNGAKIGTRILLVDQLLKLVCTLPLFLLMLFFVFTQPLLFVCSALTSIFLFSSIQMLFYAKRYNLPESLWAYSYSIFYTFSLFWITPYALATAGKSGWLTRNIPKEKDSNLKVIPSATPLSFKHEWSVNTL